MGVRPADGVLHHTSAIPDPREILAPGGGGGAHFLQLPEAEKREERIKEWDGRGRPPGTLLPVRVFGGRSPLTPPYASFRFPSLSIGRAEVSVPPGRLALSGAFFGFMNLG